MEQPPGSAQPSHAAGFSERRGAPSGRGDGGRTAQSGRRRGANGLRSARAHAPPRALFLRARPAARLPRPRGLVFSLHRFGQRNDALVLAKSSRLGDRHRAARARSGPGGKPGVTVLRQAGSPRASAARRSMQARTASAPTAGCRSAAASTCRSPARRPPRRRPARLRSQPGRLADGPAAAAAAGRGRRRARPLPHRRERPSHPRLTRRRRDFPRVSEDRPDSSGEPARGRGAAQRGERAAESGERTEILRPPAGGA